MMKAYIILSLKSLVMTIIINNLFAQNLVLNPSFEDGNIVPCATTTQHSQIYIDALDGWSSPTNGSPDVFSTQLADSCYNAQPLSTHTACNQGTQLPKTGNQFVGIYICGCNWTSGAPREYIQGQLNQVLEIGSKYLVSMYISHADSSRYASNNLGFYFSTNQIVSNILNDTLPYTPQIRFNEIVTDKINWIEQNDTLLAIDTFKYFIIGNFNSDNTTPNIGPDNSLCLSSAYYYIDDISITFISSKPEQNMDTILEKVFVPNIFSPNGDNVSDVWKPVVSSSKKNILISVYNQWGYPVFMTNNIDEGWNGQYKNRDLPVGIYIYSINTGTYFLKGNLLLIK